MYAKNTAGQFFCFQGVDATTGGIKSGVTWTVRRCIDGTFAAGGTTASEDGTTGWYKYPMTQADTNGNNISFNFTGTGAVPQTVNILTDGSSTGQHVIVDSGTVTALTNLPAITAGWLTATGIAASALNGKGDWNTTAPPTTGAIATAVWTDTTASDFTTALSVGKSVMNGVTLGTGLTVNALTTNNDKTGYTLSQSFPANFASLAITVGGAVTAGTVSDKTGYALTQAFPANFSLLSISATTGLVALQADQAVNTTKIGGTTQTARDIGAGVNVGAINGVTLAGNGNTQPMGAA